MLGQVKMARRQEPPRGFLGQSRRLPTRRLGQYGVPSGQNPYQILPGNSGGAGGPAPQHIGPDPNASTQQTISVKVFRADQVKGTMAAVRVETFSYNSTSGLPNNDYAVVADQPTDQDGHVLFSLTVPAPAQWHGFRVTAHPTSGGISFPEKSQISQGYLPNAVTATALVFAVCPSGTDDLVCEIGEMQLSYVQVLEQSRVAYGASSVDAFVIQSAHQYVPQPRNQILAKYWDQLSWGVIDLGIPPTDWPDLLKWYEQTMKLFDEIPLPPDPATKKLFRNCMRALPIFDGMPILNVRLFSKTFSTYFPREDYKIRAEMAASYLLNIHMIFECMIAKLESKARAMKKHLKNLAMIRMMAAMVFAPLAGGAMLTVLATEAAQLVVNNYGIEHGGDLQGVVAGVAKNASAGGVAIGAGLLAAGAGLMIQQITDGANPIVAKLAQTLGPKVAEAAAKDILEGVVQDGTNSGAGLLTAAGLGTAGAALAIEFLLSMITASGAKDARKFIKEAARVEDFIVDCAIPEEGVICKDLTPFVLWCIEAMMLGAFFDHVMLQAGLEGADTPGAGTPGGASSGVTQTSVIDPSASLIEQGGVSVPSNATTPGGATVSVGQSLAAVAGIGGGAALALLLTGAFSR